MGDRPSVDTDRLRLNCRNYDNTAMPPRFCGKCAVCLAADELDRWRALVNGGPCETCGGKGRRMVWGWSGKPPEYDCERPCDYCIDGHKPGIVARLEAVFDEPDCCPCPTCSPERHAILADLRSASNHGGPTP